MIKKLLAALALASLLVLGYQLPAAAALTMPAEHRAALLAQAKAAGVSEQAALKTLDSCIDSVQGDICFWNWYNFQDGGGFWKTHIQNAYGANCITLPASVRDKVTSFYFWTIDQTHPHQIRYFLWANCNPGGGYFTLSATQAANHQPDLTCPSFMNPCTPFYNDNIVSVDYLGR